MMTFSPASTSVLRPQRSAPERRKISPLSREEIEDTEISNATIRLAEDLLSRANQVRTRTEMAEEAKLARLMEDPAGKAFTFAMIDEVFRSHVSSSQAHRLRGLLHEWGRPRYLSPLDGALLQVGSAASQVLPGLVMPQIAQRLRAESANVILRGERSALDAHLARRARQGYSINLNQLGEAVLGEAEARHRLDMILTHLGNPNVTYISVKISAIFSQINLIAWDDTLREIKSRLRLIYRAAQVEHKFVNLDMEEYRDLALTLAAFREVLDEPEFMNLSAGIVLQAYLPDSLAAQRELTAWARGRLARGGAAIKLRVVKGANLAMEKVDAETHGWNPAPYGSKAESDANFRRMLEYGCRAENTAAVRLGVGSHNLFDVALALTLRERNSTRDRVELEMLEGMAAHQARVVRDAADGLLLYAPAVKEDDFLSAMAYLVRRLDENTAPDNFLRDMFALTPGSPAWERQRERFLQGWRDRLTVSSTSRRIVPAIRAEESEVFQNEPDSDFTQAPVREALWQDLRKWEISALPPLPHLDSMLRSAEEARHIWEARGPRERGRVLREAARVMAAERFHTVACLRDEGKKAVPEGDAEVSEAIDFARYYSRADIPENAAAHGVVVVAPPWNFPYAIPFGGVVAALMAGCAVILKPAPEVVQTAWLLARQLWQAGVPREVLHFFPCADGDLGRALITDSRVACVVLTGAWETARLFQQWRPGLRLYAETSGKNALVITAQADRELAIKDLVKSAFGHSGQKCSAASLAILEAEVYDDPVFRRQLQDAASSLPCGPATDPRSVVTPLIRAPGEALARALTTLDAGEEWLLKPEPTEDPCLWTPGIKLGVTPGSWFHRTECFGPVLGLMRANSLEHAVELQNGTEYGLTAGLHSLDTHEQAWWRDHVAAGNLYINRAITGAVVQRQPFGGWKRSCIGPGAKAGGPNYVSLFYRVLDKSVVPEDEVAQSYLSAWQQHFSQEHDPSSLCAEENTFRYRPCRGVILRLATPDAATLARARLAAAITGAPLEISTGDIESDQAFAARLAKGGWQAEFLRTVERTSDVIAAAARDAGLNCVEAPFSASGRAELGHWLREQAISRTRHRYGQLPGALPSRRPHDGKFEGS